MGQKYKVNFILEDELPDTSIESVREAINEAIEDVYDDLSFVGEINIEKVD